MTEAQRLNEIPVSQEIRKLLPPNAEKNKPYLLQWLRQILLMAEGFHLETGLTGEEAANLESLTFRSPEEWRSLFKALIPSSGEPWSSSELTRKIREAEKQWNDPKLMKNQDVPPAELELLQMFKENLNNSTVDLSPSLHETDR